MVQILLSVLLGLVPYGIAVLAGEKEEIDNTSNTSVFVIDGDDVRGDGFTWAADDRDCDGVRVVLASGQGGEVHVVRKVGSDGRSEAHAFTISRAVGDDAEEHGWLGVQIGTSRTTINGEVAEGGVVVVNVVKDSPADRAGLSEDDVIISINGEALEGDVGRLVKVVRSSKPGDSVTLVVVQGDDERIVDVELGTRTDVHGLAWRFDTRHLVEEIEDRIKTRVKIALRGPGGEWSVKDFGDLRHLIEIEKIKLPDGILEILPQAGAHTIRIDVRDGRKTVEIKVVRDDTTLIVSQEDDGEITVTRVDENGEETVEVYADKDALAVADEEAFEVFASADGHAVISVDVDAAMDFDFLLSDFHQHLGDFEKKLEIHLGEAGKAYETAMERLEEALESDDLLGKLKLLNLPFGMHQDDESGRRPHFAFFGNMGRAKRTFEVRSDGTIELRVRQGDSELVDLYDDENDLKSRNPGAYEKYRNLREVYD